MSKYHVGCILIGVVIGIVFAPQIQKIPGVSKIPSL